MRQKVGMTLQTLVLILTAMTPCLVRAQGAAPVSMEEQLKAQYKMVSMGADSSGPAVIDAGTILVIQKGGILSVPYSDVTLVPTKYQDGTIHSPNSMVMKGIGSLFNKANLNKQNTTRLFQVGEKVYPSKISVTPANDRVTLDIIACDSCNNVNPTTFYKSQVIFQFAKGYLATANAGQIGDTIAQVFTVDDNNGGDQQQGGNGNGNGNDQGGDQNAQGGQQQQQEPQTIQLGQSVDEVQAALGKPEKIVNLGAKQIYVYKDLKITFVKGKVTDVQ